MCNFSIYDVSKKSGVSTATVSRVLNNSPRVSQKTREKVLQVMREMDYVPNAYAQGLINNKTKTIGILYPDVADTYMARTVFFVEKALKENRYFSLLSCTGYTLEEKKIRLKMMLGQKVDGVILLGSSYTEVASEYNQYIVDCAKKIPVICINGNIEGPNIYNVLCDDLDATYRATRGLLGTGEKGRIVYLYSRDTYSNKLKIQGFLKAMLESNIPVWANSIQMCDDDVIGTLDRIFQEPNVEPVSAIMTSGDTIAIRVLKYVEKRKISVPEQLQLVGYSNVEWGQYTTPALTSVDARIEQISCTAVRTLLDVLQGKEAPQ
ncbi:LacI family DNA-binding transcriptional regulator, partial [Anaerotruncus rubiinfantis]